MPNTLASKKIVVIGGGTGVFTVLSGLKNRCAQLSAIVTMADDGGSTGILREEFGILPPGDIRRALIALSKSDNKLLAELFNYRFTEGKGLAGHAFGNLMLTALERITGNFERAVEEAGKLLSIQGQVIPVTTTQTRLIATLDDGTVVKGERNIDIPHHSGQRKIKHVALEPRATINPRAQAAIQHADIIIIGPGDLYTSQIPNLLVDGVGKALAHTSAKIIYIVNCMTKYGETDGFAASDFIKVISEYLPPQTLDYALINNVRPAVSRLKAYTVERSSFVEVDTPSLPPHPTPILTDLIRKNGLVRHDPKKIVDAIELLA